MRWKIAKTKRMIETTDLEGHTENLEMSGESVSGIVNYGVRNGELFITRDIVYPNFRIHPNDTHGSYCISGVETPLFSEPEIFDKVELSGILTIYSHTKNATIKRSFYPSTTLSCFYEDITIKSLTNDLTPVYENIKRLETKLGCEGYFYVDRVSDRRPAVIKRGAAHRVIFSYRAYFANQTPPFEKNALEKRLTRVEELLSQCDLTTGDDVIDTEFAFAKIRAGESIFRTKKGLVHCPGGYSYYAAVWCNDQLEYAAPWFAFTGDKKALEASENAFSWYEPYMNDEFSPIPSSIIAEGFDYWNGAGDRGDAAMYLYGLSRYLLTTGKTPNISQERALEWCAKYIERKIMDDGAVYSDSDELEGRLSSGVNLSTSSLAYGGLKTVSLLWEKSGRPDLSGYADNLSERIGRAFENHFGSVIKGYKTYAYHKGCGNIRVWNCLPVYMGVFDRAEDTLASISKTLWNGRCCKASDDEEIMWDRSTLYFITSLFRAGKTEQAYKMLKSYSENRLLGDRVPYPVEAYPEGKMRHLSAESALYCRVITDGLFNIAFDENAFSFGNSIPFLKGGASMKNIYICGDYRDIFIRSMRE